MPWLSETFDSRSPRWISCSRAFSQKLQAKVSVPSAPASERGLPKWTYPHPYSLLTLACIEFDTHEFSRQNKLQFAASIEMLFFQIEPYSWLKFQCRCNAT
jgi:hypothetical protein